MHDDSGQMSIDFLIGFTVFLIAFIFVATLSSGLFINLQSKTIDYDAVAYRTGVILAEDPGYAFDPTINTNTTRWELLDTLYIDRTIRFGLAISKDYPNILSKGKVQSFFTNGYGFSKDDYKSRLIFGDYPYRFNITLKSVGGSTEYPTPSVADDATYLQKYGYIRRVVDIKEPGDAVFALPDPAFATSPIVNISIGFEDLYDTERGDIYRLRPLDETIVINITNFNGRTLNDIKFNGNIPPMPPDISPTIEIYKNTATKDPTKRVVLGTTGINNLLLFIDPRYTRQFMGQDDSAGKISLNLTFDQPVVSTSQFTYTYNNAADTVITPPYLVPAVMEVKIW